MLMLLNSLDLVLFNKKHKSVPCKVAIFFLKYICIPFHFIPA